MVIVHHLSNSHSHVILWLMEELGVDYQIVNHQRDPKTGQSPESLRKIHPVAKAPTIEDRGVIMVESTGIILYLLESYGGGRLRPAPDTPDAMRFFQWLTFIEGSAKAPLAAFFRLRGVPADDPRRIAAEQGAARPLAQIEAALEVSDTLVPGMFTAADMQLTFLEEIMEAVGQIDHWPAMRSHLARMRQRDGYRRAEAKGGPVGLKQLFSAVA